MKYRLNENVIYAAKGEMFYLFHKTTGEILELNEVGQALIMNCVPESNRNVTDIKIKCDQEDLNGLIEILIVHNLIQPVQNEDE